MGIDPMTLAIIGGTLASAGAGIYGANSQNSTANANLDAMRQQQQFLRGAAANMYQGGTNPYAQAMLNFVGQGSVGQQSSPFSIPVNPFLNSYGPASGSGSSIYSGISGPTGYPGNPSGDPFKDPRFYPPDYSFPGRNVLASAAGMSRLPASGQPTSGQPTYNQAIYGQPYNQPAYNQSAYNQPGYTQPSYTQPGYNPYAGIVGQRGITYGPDGFPQASRTSSLDANGREVVSGVDSYGNPFSFHPIQGGSVGPGGRNYGSALYANEDILGYDRLQEILSKDPNMTLGQAVDQGLITKEEISNSYLASRRGEFDTVSGDWRDKLVGATSDFADLIGLSIGDQNAWINSVMQPSPTARNSGFYDSNGNWHPIDRVNGPQLNLVNGQYIFNGQPIGDIYNNPNGFDPLTGKSLGGTPNNGTIDPSTGSPIEPIQTIGPIGQPGKVVPGQAGGMYRYTPSEPFLASASTLGAAPLVDTPQIAQIPGFNAPQMGSLPGFVPPAIQGVGQSQGINSAQDGLLQMMRRNLTPEMDAGFSSNLSDVMSGKTAFDNSDIFKALAPLEQQATDKQVGQLHASAGSLGERFGTAMANNEALMRGQIQNNLNLQHAQMAQQSFEAAQGRRMQGLGLMQTELQNRNQFGLANAGLQLNAGQAAAQAALQAGGMDLQAGIANAGNATQAGMQGQSLAAQLMQANAGNQMQAGLANQALQAQISQANAANMLQGGLANQNVLAQYATNNANILNQNSQFNAGQRTAQDQFNASQGNIYNNTIMQALASAGGMQQNQLGFNAGLLGMLAGVQMPQASPSAMPGAIGDAASSLSFLPMMLSMLGRSNPASYSPYMSPYASYGRNV